MIPNDEIQAVIQLVGILMRERGQVVNLEHVADQGGRFEQLLIVHGQE